MEFKFTIHGGPIVFAVDLVLIDPMNDIERGRFMLQSFDNEEKARRYIGILSHLTGLDCDDLTGLDCDDLVFKANMSRL